MLVTVTTNDLTHPPPAGEVVTFSIIAGDGTIKTPDGTTTAGMGDDPLTVPTDDNGKAYVNFYIPAAGLGDTIIRAQIEGTTNGGDAASIVYWKGIVPTLTLAASLSSVVEGGTSTLTATVTDGSGNAIIGAPVAFQIEVNNSGAPVLIIVNGTTDGSGRAVATYTAGANPGVDNVSARTSYLGFTSAAAVDISVTAPAAP
jgi:hypothetical protein